MHKRFFFIIIALALLPTGGCGKRAVRYSTEIYGTFDTVVEVIAYADSKEEFDAFAGTVRAEMLRLHKLFDIYNDYKGLTNLKTVNDSAGIAPVKAGEDLVEFLLICRNWYEKSGGAVNVALGPVLRIWHDYRELYADDPEGASIPPMNELDAARNLCDVRDMFIDEASGRVSLRREGMTLDAGAMAKGYAAERAADLAEGMGGIRSFLINAGGNVVTRGKPQDGRNDWGIGIQDPDGEGTFATLRVCDKAVVTSGDYQRFYMVGTERMSHIIDPETLMPASAYRSVTVIADDSAVADALSTALFIMPLDEGMALAEAEGCDALWFAADGSIHCTEGMRTQLKNP